MFKAVSRNPFRMRGFSLVELMIAMVLGLLVVGAAGSLFLANRRVYGSTETVNRIQENGRAAFEIMSRDLREAGGNPCLPAGTSVTNNLNSSASAWWQDYALGITGTEGGAAADSVLVHMAGGAEYRVVNHDASDSDVQLDRTAGMVAGGLYLICNPRNGVIFKATAVNASANTIAHAQSSEDDDPSGNSSASFPCGDPVDEFCDGGYRFQDASIPTSGGAPPPPALVVPVYSVRWEIAANGRGGSSLYRTVVVNTGGGAPAAADMTRSEVAEGVTGLQLSYKIGDAPNYNDADDVADWSAVTAVKVVLTLQGTEGALNRGDIRGTDNEVLTRQLVNVVAIRNRGGIL